MAAARFEFVEASPGSIPAAGSCVGYGAVGQPRGTHLGLPSTSLTFILDGPVVGAWSDADLGTDRASVSEIVLSDCTSRSPTSCNRGDNSACR